MDDLKRFATVSYEGRFARSRHRVRNGVHEKSCTGCGEFKSADLEHFHKDSRGRLRSHCKVCVASEARQSYRRRCPSAVEREPRQRGDHHPWFGRQEGLRMLERALDAIAALNRSANANA